MRTYAKLEGEGRALVSVGLIRVVGGVIRHQHVLVADTMERLRELEHVDIPLVRPDLLEVVQALSSQAICEFNRHLHVNHKQLQIAGERTPVIFRYNHKHPVRIDPNSQATADGL